MYNPIDEYAKAHQRDLLAEAQAERSLDFLRGERPGLRDTVLIVTGNWMISLGRRLHNSTHCPCVSNKLSENRA
jgi:hypothetical protein